MRSLPGDIALRAVRLPGRESRFGDAPCTSMSALVEEAGQRLLTEARHETRPIGLVGVCSGALLAAAVVVSMPELADAISLVAVVRQPFPPAVRADTSALSSREFRALVEREQATPAEILDDARMFEVFEPTLRADFKLAEAAGEFLRETTNPTTTPFLALHPMHDPALRAADLEGWANLTTSFRGVRSFAGGRDPLVNGHEGLAAQLAAAMRGECRGEGELQRADAR